MSASGGWIVAAALTLGLCAGAAPSSDGAPRIIGARSPSLQIIDGGDRLAGVLSKHVDPDVYVVHPTSKAKMVSYITDAGRADFTVVPGGHYDFAIRYQGRLYNQRIATTDPNAARYAGAAALPGGIDTIPFTLGPNNAIHVKGSINGSRPLDLIFDTGAALGVYNEGSAAKGARMLPGRHNRIQFGNVVIEGLPLVQIDYNGTARTEGVIGFDSVAGRVVAIDYERQFLMIFHDLPDVAGFVRVPVTWREQNSMVPLTISTPAGPRNIMALFDTGSRWSLTMGNQDAAAGAMRSLDSIGTHTGRKADGTSVVADVVTLPWASIGGLRLEKVQADVERPSAGTNLPLNIIGNDFLKRFNVIIDYRSSEVYLKPNYLVGSPYNRVFPLRAALAGCAATVIAMLGLLWHRARRRRGS